MIERSIRTAFILKGQASSHLAFSIQATWEEGKPWVDIVMKDSGPDLRELRLQFGDVDIAIALLMAVRELVATQRKLATPKKA